jgi:predicted small lipoprotein YifL
LSGCLRAGFALALLGFAAVALAACGRAGPPELPPGPVFSSYPQAAAAPVAPPAPPGSAEDIREKQYEKSVQNGFDRNSNPVAPPSERRSFILDFLLQ